jgi:uncharacterized protein YutE (UPF0331/DUF86 family)
MVEAESARRLLNVLLDCLSDLGRYRSSITRDQLGTQRDAQHMVLHALYVAVQAAVDLAMHVGADEGLPEATTYQDAFRRLADAGLIERELAERLAGWAGFRNVLAHLYATIDYGRVYDALQEIGDLEDFAKIVSRKLRS